MAPPAKKERCCRHDHSSPAARCMADVVRLSEEMGAAALSQQSCSEVDGECCPALLRGAGGAATSSQLADIQGSWCSTALVHPHHCTHRVASSQEAAKPKHLHTGMSLQRSSDSEAHIDISGQRRSVKSWHAGAKSSHYRVLC